MHLVFALLLAGAQQLPGQVPDTIRATVHRLFGTRDFARVRCGIGRQRAGDRRDLADWVLAPFEPDEDALLPGTARAAVVEVVPEPEPEPAVEAPAE